MRFFLFCFTFCAIALYKNAWAQKILNLPNYDNRRYHYGFQLGLFNSTLNLYPKAHILLPEDTVSYVAGNSNAGFLIGFLLNRRLKDELWSLRFVPSVSFYEYKAHIEFKNSKFHESITVQSTYIEMPLLIKYRSLRRHNFRMYMVGGTSYSFQVGGGKGADELKTLALIRDNAEIVYGFGFDFYFQMFKFAPEIRISHGLTNVLDKQFEKSYFTQASEQIFTHKVALIFNFE
ncbi:MAG: PorT family protein [Cytophagales bacterium]|nr:PorT family protein [Cytophagales bacterium]MDW8384019.1 outer membrane beta-barrel protein [Flammeovirgaceae bacterium]